MGSGASSTKNAVIPMEKDCADKEDYKCQIYEKKLDAMAKTLTAAEAEKKELSSEVDRLNGMVTELEGEKMDLADTIASLDHRLESFMSEGGGDRYEETLKAKDQIIANFEKKIAEMEADFTKQRSRWRRKLRNLGTQLAEAKHSGAIRVMELRQEVTRLTEESERFRKRKERAAKADTAGYDTGTESESAVADRSSHGLVMELSQQMLEQTGTIRRLEQSLQERERQLDDLRTGLVAQRAQRKRQPAAGKSAGSRQWSGYSQDSGLDSDVAPDSAGLGDRRGTSGAAASLSPLSERDSGAAVVPDDELYGAIAEDRNWDAASLGSSDTVGPSPRHLVASGRPCSARREASARPGLDRGRSIILDPDKEHTIDSVLQLTKAY